MGGKNQNRKAKPGHDAGKQITDPRFASVHTDPRFREPPRHKAKVAVDSRFSQMFTDKRFGHSDAPTDKRGKPKKKNDSSAANPLAHYYRVEDEKLKPKVVESEESSSDDDEENAMGGSKDKKNQNRKAKPGYDAGKQITDHRFASVHTDPRFRVENDKELKLDEKLKTKAVESEESSSDDDDKSEEEEVEVESDDDSSSTTDSDEEEEEEEEVEEEEEKIPEIDKETNRLAVMNMDWSEVKAVDLFVLLSSFLPKEGRIVSVAVYPSEFGLKRMAEEELRGPALFRKDGEKKEESDEDEDDDEDEEDYDAKVRAYELSRLRYFHGVVEFDSVATADYIYKNCDGLEFERSGAKLDLRFIPDSLEFNHPPRDVANKAPTDYEGVDFNTRALQLSKVDLTWDDDEPHRSKTLKRKFNDDQLAELEMQEFVASDEGESDSESDSDADGEGDDENVRMLKKQKKEEAYRALLEGLGENDNEDEDEKGMDMEITYNTGLEDISKRHLEKKDRQSESVWDAYLRERKKKKASKKRSKDSSDDDSPDDYSDQEPPEQPDDFFVDDLPAKGSKQAKGKDGKKRKQTKEKSQADEASRAELELLLADDGGASNPDIKGYNLKKKKKKKTKGKKGKDDVDEAKLPAAEYDDTRFSGLFTSPEFALDPTDPQFKRSAVYARQMASGKTENKEIKPEETKVVQNEEESQDNASKRGKLEISKLVKSLKMKTQQQPLQRKVRQLKNISKPGRLAKS